MSVICHAILYSSFNYYSYLTQTKLYNSFPAELFSKSKVSSSEIQFFPAQILIYFGVVEVIFSNVYINSEISEAFGLHVTCTTMISGMPGAISMRKAWITVTPMMLSKINLLFV